MAVLGLLTAPENAFAAVEQGLELFDSVVAEGLKDDEVERVKTSLEAEIAYGKETVESYARRLGYYYVQFGDPDYENKYLQTLLAVTKEEAQESLRDILNARPVISIVHPVGKAVEKAKLAALFKARKQKKSVKIKIDRSPVLPELVTHGTLRFVTKRVDALPMIAMRMIFPGGSRVEDPSKYGLGSMYQRVWASGTQNYNSLQIAKILEGLGASVHAFCGKNTFGLSMECLAKHWPIVKPIVTEVLLNPTFPDHEFQIEKELTLREIFSEKDSPAQLCHLNFMNALYGEHPYGRSSIGTKTTVESLTTSDLKDFYKNYVTQNSVVISTVGNVNKQNWVAEWQAICQQLPKTGKAFNSSTPVKSHRKVEVIVEKKEPLFQSHMLVGFLGASFKEPERYALKILSSCLAGQGGRLFLELRDRQSLAYSVSPINSDSPDTGVFGFYIGCSTEKLQTALRGIRSELQKILDKPIGAKELSRAKEYWIGRFELEMQRYAAQSMLFGLDEIYGLGYRHSMETPAIVKALSAVDIQQAARKFLNPEIAVISVVHNAELDPEILRNLWHFGFRV
jgi:zinc protease